MMARELMSANPACCTPDDTVREAARLMVEYDCGCIPVVGDTTTGRPVGTITDRDIACRCIAEDKGPDTRVSEVMSRDAKCCDLDADLAAVERIMAAAQVRRVPVVDERGRCVGVIAQADLALNHKAATEHDVAVLVERISQPVEPAGATA